MKPQTTQNRTDEELENGNFAPRPLSAKQTIIMTAVILGGFAVLMGLLWVIN